MIDPASHQVGDDGAFPAAVPGWDDPIVAAAYATHAVDMRIGCWSRDRNRLKGRLIAIDGMPSMEMSEGDRCEVFWGAPTHTSYEVRRYAGRHDYRTLTLYGLPETIATSLTGMGLREVVSMPGAERMTIASVHHMLQGLPGSVASGGTTRLTLRPSE